jgi:hypothetical protein
MTSCFHCRVTHSHNGAQTLVLVLCSWVVRSAMTGRARRTGATSCCINGTVRYVICDEQIVLEWTQAAAYPTPTIGHRDNLIIEASIHPHTAVVKLLTMLGSLWTGDLTVSAADGFALPSAEQKQHAIAGSSPQSKARHGNYCTPRSASPIRACAWRTR